MKLMFFLVLMFAVPGWSVETVSTETLAKLTKLDGSGFPIESRRVFVYFWATWCPDCKEKLHKEFRSMSLPADVSFVTVNTDKEISRAKNFVEKENLQLPVARDNSKELAQKLKVFSVPYWAVLEKAGAVWKIVDAEAGGNLDKARAALKMAVK